MALSPADFYAFSQATGSPVPEDPESRARIAPQVADWRRNQLKSPETKQADNSGLLNALGITAAVGGGAALLAGALGRRGGVRMGNAKQAARQAAQQVEVTDFGNVYTAAGRPAPSRPAPTPTPTAAAPQRPTGSRQGGIKFADLSQITGTEPRGLLRGRQPGGEITTVPGRGALTSLEITEVPVVDITEAAGQPRLPGGKDFIAGYFQKTGTPAGYLTEARRQVPADSQIVAVQTEKPASLVDRQQAIQSLVPDQAFNALDAAEDQMTGRVKQQLQRNEDLDMSQIDLLEEIAEYNRIQGMEQDEPINSVASQLADGLPTDQAEGIQVSAQKFVQNKLREQRREKPLDVEYKMYDLVASAAEKGYKLEPNRALAILTNPTIELTTDERNLFSVNPDIGKFALRGQSFDPGERQTGAMLGIKGELLKSVPNIGLDPSSSVTQAASGTSIRGRSRVQNMPDEFRLRVSSSGRPVEEDFISVDEGGTVTAYPGEELTELEMGENVAPYTRLVRNQVTGEMQPEYAPKVMRAVNTAEGKTYFVPVKDPGGVGIYGEERAFASGPLVKFSDPTQERVAGEYTKTASRVPTELPYKERGRDPFAGVSNEGLMRALEKSGRTGQTAIQNELQRRQRVQQSVAISEELRRANIEGRDPQEFLQNFEFKQQEPVMTQTANPGYARYSPQGYEVSSRGDKRYSAMYATLPTGQTIEQAYQSAKGTGKGQPAKDPNFDYYGTYKGLWDQYFDANPESLNEIARVSKGKVLTDQFASTVNNQARAIHDILTERGLR